MSPPRIELRPPPNRGFLQGYPGIPASETRPEAHLSGAIAVQIPSSKGVEAAWLRVEMCKTETLPRGESWKELIGQGPVDVWTAGADGSGWATLTTVCAWHSLQRQCPFRLRIPERLPPTLSLEKGGGITYKLIASLKVRLKKGLMRKELYETVVQDVRDIVLEKHEQHSTWPIYNVPEEFEAHEGAYHATLYRHRRAYAPTDELDVRVIVMAQTPKPAKLKSITVGVRQTVTFFHDTQQASRPNDQRSIMLVSKSKSLRKKIQPGEYFLQDMSLVIPKNHTIMSVNTAKHIEVSHSLRVLIQMDKTTITLDRIHMLISGFMPNVSTAAIARIGPVPALDVLPESNPHAVRADTTVFVPDETARLPEVLPGVDASPVPAPPPANAAIYMDEHVPFPNFGQNDAEFLGTPTPRRHVTAPQEAELVPPNAMPVVHMRPGDIYPTDPMASPSRNSMSSHAYSGSGAGHIRALSASSIHGSFDMAPGQRPVSVFMEPPGSTAAPYRTSRTFPSAEQEKVRLFEQARAEAAHFQSQMESGVSFPDPAPPILVDGEYDQAGGVPIHTSTRDAPGSSHAAAEPVSLSEKEQLRRYQEAQDAVAQHLQAQEAPVSATSESSPSPFLTKSEQRAMEEKSQLQSHYAQMNAEASAPAPAPTETQAPAASTSDPPPRPPKVPLP
ncbi:hypothetical protein MCAP1_003418 [Malassezia caprae]|uniref:Arrestin C-terminal-like domain-containing protein n=1 Tax=Malassezia caprae TaxID=1381934 RepID=A0AAF0IWU0_9BASI|nr:hypothetical protein MCAP1_003418 [Malassezia caprae]